MPSPPAVDAVPAAAAQPTVKIHARQAVPTNPPAAFAPPLQLPYAEQDDDFVEFARSLRRLPTGAHCIAVCTACVRDNPSCRA